MKLKKDNHYKNKKPIIISPSNIYIQTTVLSRNLNIFAFRFIRFVFPTVTHSYMIRTFQSGINIFAPFRLTRYIPLSQIRRDLPHFNRFIHFSTFFFILHSRRSQYYNITHPILMCNSISLQSHRFEFVFELCFIAPSTLLLFFICVHIPFSSPFIAAFYSVLRLHVLFVQFALFSIY